MKIALKALQKLLWGSRKERVGKMGEEDEKREFCCGNICRLKTCTRNCTGCIKM